MSTEILQNISESNLWWALGPELTLVVGALSLLVLEIVAPKKDLRYVPHLTVATLLVTLVSVMVNFDKTWAGEDLFGGLIRLNGPGQVGRLFFVLSSLLVCFVASVSLPRAKAPKVEFYHIVLIVTAAMMLLVHTNHFVMFFVALETVTIGFYILVSYYRERSISLEAGLKYLVLGALSSAILLFGIVLVYGAVGRVEIGELVKTGFNFDTVQLFLMDHPDNFLATAGALLVIGGIAFKIGAFPFQIWVPDVYQGAPTPVTAFLAVSSKAAGFAILMLLVHGPFAPLKEVLVPVLSLLAGATILFGNLSALTQRNTKRLMGLSGVSHAGYLLVGVVASMTVPWATGAVWFYLITYMLASMAVFGVMAYVAGPDDTAEELDHYDRLARERPFLAAVLAIGLGSLAGIPPLAGFMGKLLIFVAAFHAGLYGLLAVAIIGVVISIFYYFGWLRSAFFDAPVIAGVTPSRPAFPAPTWIGIAVLVLLGIASVLLGFYQQPLTGLLFQ